MVKKGQVITLLATAMLLPSCGQQIHSDSVSSYWETIQNEPSPYGYYRMKDGWYQGEATRDVFWLASNNEKISRFVHVEEKVAMQIEWRQERGDFGMGGPFGCVTGLEAHYYYEDSQHTLDRVPMKATSSVYIKEGQFSIEQTEWLPADSDPTTQNFYGTCEKINLRTSWGESYLVSQERQNYSFSDSDKILKMTERYAGTNGLCTSNCSIETLFSFNSDLDCVNKINYWGEGTDKEFSDAGELVMSGARNTYNFAYQEDAPNFEVSQKGIRLEEYPWYEFEFAAMNISLIRNY